MVHALEEIQRLLKPEGCLIDIHPVPEDSLVVIDQDGRVLFTESVPVNAHFYKDVSQAEAALAQVVQRGLFNIERSIAFDFTTYASSVAELQEFKAKADSYDDSPKDEVLEAQRTAQYARVNEIMKTARDGVEVVYHDQAHMTRLNLNVMK